MNPMLLQKQLRDNAADLNDFYKELKSWGDDMKKKEESLRKNNNTVSQEETLPKKKKKSEKPAVKTKFGYTDYKAWDKFDADAECEKVDYDENEESELTDECDETVRDEAYLEKEKGNKFVKAKKWDEAIECYNKAIDLFSYDPIFYANRALCFLKKENYVKAELDCTMSLKLDKTYVKALQRRAAAREALGKLKEAKADLIAVLELEPKNNESKTNLDNLDKKLAKVVEVSQRPVSKFTASRNRKRDVDKNYGQNIESDVILVKAINKPVHLQSKKPLKRIEIKEITETIDVRTLKTDDLKIIEKKPEVTNIHQIKENKNNVNANKTHLCIPNNSVQFYSCWRHLKSDDYKYEYLKMIKPKDLPVIFKESLESGIFSEILEVLARCFIERKEDVFGFLLFFTKIRRFSAIIMFLSDNDKNCLQKLFNYIRGNTDYSKEEIDVLFETYELNN